MAARERHRRSRRKRHLALTHGLTAKGPNCSIRAMACRRDQSSSATRNPKASPEPSCCAVISSLSTRVAICPLNELEMSKFGAAS
jgi:hypothetical protein